MNPMGSRRTKNAQARSAARERCLVEIKGFEPSASALRRQRSPN